jgi:hypothetical protein
MFTRGSSVHQKRSNYALTNLLFGLCRFIWIINVVTLPIPHPGTPAYPFTPKVLWIKERAPIPYSSIVFTSNSHLNLSKIGCRNPSFGLVTKARVARLQAKRKEVWERKQRHWKGVGQEEARESPHTPGSLRKCEGVWGSEHSHSHSQGNSHFGRRSPSGLPKFQRTSWRVKSQWIVTLLVPLESSWNVNV